MHDGSTTSLGASYGATGFSARLGFGRTPALVLIDLCEAYYREGSPLHHPRFGAALPAQMRLHAAALDTCQNGFRPMVVREACADRHEAPHEQNLFDIDAKYGDVVTEGETVAYLRSLGPASR